MKCIAINREGHFDNWESPMLEEVSNFRNTGNDNPYMIYQNHRIRLNVTILEPYERVPFRIILNDFSLICLSGGLAISRFSHGGISLMQFKKGEHYDHTLKQSCLIHDLQNVGEQLLVLAMIEYKGTFSLDAHPPKLRETETIDLP